MQNSNKRVGTDAYALIFKISMERFSDEEKKKQGNQKIWENPRDAAVLRNYQPSRSLFRKVFFCYALGKCLNQNLGLHRFSFGRG